VRDGDKEYGDGGEGWHFGFWIRDGSGSENEIRDKEKEVNGRRDSNEGLHKG
jgi:hypothetical protein